MILCLRRPIKRRRIGRPAPRLCSSARTRSTATRESTGGLVSRMGEFLHVCCVAAGALAVVRRTLPGYPHPQGLYDPRHEHDSCGVGFVANIKGRKSHEVVAAGLEILVNLDHRGAVGAD